MNLSRNLIQGAAGGLIAAAALGFVEAVYLLSTQGAPDHLSPLYATVLYALIGLPLGLGAGLVLSGLEKYTPLGERDDAFAFAFGSVGSVAPMGLFILMYVVNKVVYLEAGIPTTGKLAILGAIVVYAAVELTAGAALLRGPLGFLLRGPGVLGGWGVLLLATGAYTFVPSGDDPRAHWAHGKGVPDAMADGPNVIVLTIDTLRADYLGTYGKEGDPSPVLDTLAADGIVFENAFAHASWTRSSFASLWSSRIPSSHNSDTKAARMPDDLELLSEVVQAAGGTTANLANNINVTSTFNFDQGYDTFIYESPDYAFGATESVFSLTFYKVVHKLHEKLGSSKEVSRFYQPAEVVFDDAKGFIEANRDDRWMLGVHLMEPHDPYFEHPYLDGSGDAEFNGVGYARAEHEHPDPELADYLKEVYLDEIRHMDRKIAEFKSWLEAEGLYDDTMIVITADHGEEFGEHDGFWHGTTLFEEQIHVPLIVKLPGGELAGSRIPWQARLIDVAPTIAAAMGAEPSSQWEGIDLLAEVREAAAKAEAEATAAAQALADAEAAVTEARAAAEAAPEDPTLAEALTDAEDALAALSGDDGADDPCAAYGHPHDRLVVAEQDFEGNVLSAIRKDGFKYIKANEGNPRGLPTEALYDMVEDRAELDNLMGESGNRCGRFVNDLPRTLGEEMGERIQEAMSQASDGGSAEISEAEKQKLCALGYLSGEDCE